MKLPISLVIVTLNEEKNIGRCLKSAPWADEILVLDSGSQDRTTEIAQNLGARVFSEPWRGYGPQKHRAAELAKNDWVFAIDADEEISADLSAEIVKKFSQLNSSTAYRIPRKSFYLGRWILHGGWYPDFQTRLFHRRFHQWNDQVIHEKVEAKSQENFSFSILHYVFRDVSQHVITNNRYSELQAQQHLANGGKFSWFKFLTKPMSKFLECYFLKLGFLDGFAGYFIAVSAAYSVFIRWAKIKQFSDEKGSHLYD